MNRRVVVTGVGLVCGCGIGTEEVWRNLLAGKSGIGPITHFDATAFDCRIAGEVSNFDPLELGREKRTEKDGPVHSARPGRFGFRDAAWPGLEVTPEIADADRRLHRLRHRRIRRDRARALEISAGRPRQDFSLFHSCRDRQSRLRARLDSLRREGPEFARRPRLARLPRTPLATPSRSFSAATRK